MKDRFKNSKARDRVHRDEQNDRAARAHHYAVERAAKPHRVIVPSTRVKETVEEFLARGGQIKDCGTSTTVPLIEVTRKPRNW